MAHSFPNASHMDIHLKETPDFHPMVQILFWNSTGFFFFSFIIPIITGVLLKATGTEIGLIYSIRVMGGLISLPMAGYLTDHQYSKQAMVLFGSIGRGTAYVILFFAIQFRSFTWIAISMFVQGFGTGVFWPPFDALIAEKTSKYHRSYAFGQRGGQIGWGNLVGTLISFAIFSTATVYAPENTWILYFPLLFFAFSNYYAGWIFYQKVDHTLTFERFLAENPDIALKSLEMESNCTQQSEKHINTHTTNQSDLEQTQSMSNGLKIGLGLLFLAIIITSLNEIIAKPFIQLYLIDNIVSNTAIVMLIYFPSEIIALIIAPVLGEYADRMNEYVGITITCIIGALVTWLLISTFSAGLFCFLLIADATLARLSGLIIQNILSRSSPKHRGMIFSLKTWMAHIGELVGPVIGGILWDNYGQRSPFIASIYIELSLIPIFLISFYILQVYLVEKINDRKGKTF